jgi:hypothetical protein
MEFRRIRMRKYRSLKILAVLLFLTTVFLAGCINYDQQVELNSNGSGKMLIHYSLAQQLVGMMAMGQASGDQKKDMPFKVNEPEIRKDLGVKGVRIDKFEQKTEGDQTHFYITVSFDNIQDLNQSEMFKKMPFSWTKSGSVTTFTQTLQGNKEKKEEAANDQMGKQMAQAMFGNAAFKFTVKLPGKALPSPDTNGTIDADGKTVSWSVPLVEAMDKKTDTVMSAKFKTGFPVMWILGIAGGGILFLIAVMVIVMVMRKK